MIMKYLLLICCIGLFSCGDEEVLNVFIENQPNINKDFTPKIKYSTVSISGLIKNGEGLSVVLESPLMSNKIKLDSTTIDKDDKFNTPAFNFDEVVKPKNIEISY